MTLRYKGGDRPGQLRWLAPATVALLLPLLPDPTAAQGLRQQIERSRAALVRFSFPARPGVCGAGNAILVREPDGRVTFMNHDGGDVDGWRAGQPPCDTGDVRVTAERDGGRIRRFRVRVGARPRGPDAGDPAGAMAADFGRVSGQAAADALLGLVPAAEPRPAGRMILAASLADRATTWPALLRIGRDRTLDDRIRKDALFWAARQAEAKVVDELGGIARDRTEDDEVRAAAVFALSQLPVDQAVPRLLELGRTASDPFVRGKALFWLAQFDDPRVVDAFEEILAGGGGSR